MIYAALITATRKQVPQDVDCNLTPLSEGIVERQSQQILCHSVAPPGVPSLLVDSFVKQSQSSRGSVHLPSGGGHCGAVELLAVRLSGCSYWWSCGVVKLLGWRLVSSGQGLHKGGMGCKSRSECEAPCAGPSSAGLKSGHGLKKSGHICVRCAK